MVLTTWNHRLIRQLEIKKVGELLKSMAFIEKGRIYVAEHPFIEEKALVK